MAEEIIFIQNQEFIPKYNLNKTRWIHTPLEYGGLHQKETRSQTTK